MRPMILAYKHNNTSQNASERGVPVPTKNAQHRSMKLKDITAAPQDMTAKQPQINELVKSNTTGDIAFGLVVLTHNTHSCAREMDQ